MPAFEPELVFRINPKIMFVELATLKGKVVAAETRPGKLDSSQFGQAALFGLRSELLAEIDNRATSPTDKIEFALTSYGNRYGLIIPHGEEYIRLIVEKDATFQEVTEIVQSIRRTEM